MKETAVDEATTSLVSAAQAGDPAALEALARRYLPKVRRLVALKLGSRLRDLEDHEDLVQDAALKVFGSLHSYRKLSTARFYHFVATCVLNLIRDRFRARSKEVPGSPGGARRLGELGSESLSASFFAGSDSWTPGRALALKELEEALEDALLELPEHHRELFNCVVVCGMSYEEAAQVLGFSDLKKAAGTLRTRMNRIREAIIAALRRRNVLPEGLAEEAGRQARAP